LPGYHRPARAGNQLDATSRAIDLFTAHGGEFEVCRGTWGILDVIMSSKGKVKEGISRFGVGLGIALMAPDRYCQLSERTSLRGAPTPVLYTPLIRDR